MSDNNPIEPGLNINELAERLQCSKHKAMKWAAYNAYKVMDGRFDKRAWKVGLLPTSANGIPQDLAIVDVQKHLGVCYITARSWIAKTGYKFKDGRTLRSGRPLRSPEEIEQRKAILREFSDLTLEAVGEKLGVTRQRAEQLYKKYNIPHLSQNFGSPHCKRISIAQKIPKEKLQQLADAGFSCAEIAGKEGVDKKVIYQLASNYKVGIWGNDVKRLEKQGLRFCTFCKETKVILTDFYGNRGRCKECLREYYRKKDTTARRNINLSPDDLRLTEIG